VLSLEDRKFSILNDIRGGMPAELSGTRFELCLAILGIISEEHRIERSIIMALPTRVARGISNDPFEAVQREFDMLNRIFGGNQEGNGNARLAPYGVDIREDGDHIYVEAELPGFKKDEVDITLENQTLTISAERSQTSKPAEGVKGDLLLHERRYSRFLRSFTLPPTVDERTVNAKLTDGVLTITLNKREETKPRKIQVG
jgi:HSP20 family protein